MYLFVVCLLSFCALPQAFAQGHVFDSNNLNTAVDPRTDFYQYANGGWLQRTAIPAEYGRWGSFEELQETVQVTLRAVAEEASAARHKPGSVSQKVGDFYASGMNTAAIEAAGIQPLAAVLQQIAAVHDAATLATAMAALHQSGADAAFAFGARPDDKDSTTVIAQVYQSGLGLPERDYYFAPDKSDLRVAYMRHIAAMLALLGEADAPEMATHVMAIETELAKASLSAVDRRDTSRTYNITNVAQLTQDPQPFAWAAYFEAVGLPEPGRVNVENPAFVRRLGELSHTLRASCWQAYLRWHVVHAAAPFLGDAFVQESFHFNGTVLQGTPALRPRWKRVLSSTDGLLGEALGQLYVARAFPPQAKERAAHIVSTLRDALRERLASLAWMAPLTRHQALAKLDTFNVKIGYPDSWIDYTPVAIASDAYAANVQRAEAFLFAREVARIGKPVDRSRWEMTPQTVNAYYDPQLNEIVFPAAILQYPFFDADADDAFNYGAMGAVIGHEMTHGYDDQGRQYDAHGNMQDWWTPEDATQFKSRAGRVVEQFNGYTLFDHPVNGALTQGENIADLGGLKVAYLAWQKSQHTATSAGHEPFTGEQRFFLAWAQIWRNQVRRETALQRLATDPHAPGEWRVNGPLANMPEFYAAFGVTEHDAMYRAPDVRVAIW